MITIRLTQERLAAITNFIPVREKLREKLQRRQQLQTDFSVGPEDMFKPIPSATKDVSVAIYGDIPGEERNKKTTLLGLLENIAAETEKTQQGIQELSSDIKTQREYDIDVSTPVPPEQPEEGDIGDTQGVSTQRGVYLIDKLTEEDITDQTTSITEIKRL